MSQEAIVTPAEANRDSRAERNKKCVTRAAAEFQQETGQPLVARQQYLATH
jgi:hypothetical protein